MYRKYLKKIIAGSFPNHAEYMAFNSNKGKEKSRESKPINIENH
jgi:hypothetical protein